MVAGKNSNYQTQNTALAAWLHSQGTRLITVDIFSNGATFIFEQPRDGLIAAYIESESFNFFNSYKYLLDYYHEKKRMVQDGKAKTG